MSLIISKFPTSQQIMKNMCLGGAAESTTFVAFLPPSAIIKMSPPKAQRDSKSFFAVEEEWPEALQKILSTAKLAIFLAFSQGEVTTCEKHGTEDVDVLALALHVCRAQAE